MSVIKPLETMEHLEALVSPVAADTLLLFDVGGVLLNAGDPLFQAEIKPIRERLHAAYLAPLGQERHDYLWSLILKKAFRQLVEEQTPRIIKKLQDQGVQVMALTALPTGKLGAIDNMEDWRLATLAAHGITFTPVAKELEHFELDELREQGFSPVYKKGALFTYKQPKGLALTAFLQKINWKPQHIIFVDDSRSNLEGVAHAVEKLSIPYTGAHYEFVKRLHKPFDEELAHRRFKYLAQNGVWLTEDEARAV